MALPARDEGTWGLAHSVSPFGQRATQEWAVRRPRVHTLPCLIQGSSRDGTQQPVGAGESHACNPPSELHCHYSKSQRGPNRALLGVPEVAWESRLLRRPPFSLRMATKKKSFGNSLAVQWLGLCASTAGGMVQSLVEELTSHLP